MRKLAVLCVFISSIGFGQSTDMVFKIFRTKCAFSSCHSNSNKAAGLDLEGGATTPRQDVINNLYNVDPTNPYAKNNGYKRVHPGDPYRSTLFRKINEGLDDFINMNVAEGQKMPVVGSLTDFEKEMIRQWILYNVPTGGNFVDTSLIGDYYRGNGIPSFTKRPEPPVTSEGYQLKLGPFFIGPVGSSLDEVEYLYRYDLHNDQPQEVKRVDMFLNENSHHFILYNYQENPDSSHRFGLIHSLDHADVGIAAVAQESDSIKLPEGTGFFWDKNTSLNLNSHYLNYRNQVLACEVYVNIYTQPPGTAKQEMKTRLLSNRNIPIPNTGDTVTITHDIVSSPRVDRYIWGMTSHTHAYGKDYDVWMRKPDGSEGEQIFDGTHINGDPGLPDLGFYDYQHPPVRYWDFPFMHYNSEIGLIHRAKWVNNGPDTVNWGGTSKDEMMITIIMYVEDTAGLGAILSAPSFQNQELADPVICYYNRNDGRLYLKDHLDNQFWALSVFDITGREIFRRNNIMGSSISLGNQLNEGIFIFRVQQEKNNYTGKIFVH